MEIKNNQVISNFITNSEKIEIINFVNTIRYNPIINNRHIKEISKNINGNSFMFDITNTQISNYLSSYQSNNNTIKNIDLPDILFNILDRISIKLNISKDNVFLQILDMNQNGLITPHYDTTYSGYINFKCNISVLSEDYIIYIDKDKMNIKELDLYTFESSLYKHWTDKFSSQRILLSYGFILKYDELGRTEDDYRVRLSKRIEKRLQN